jgi:hypothetical protein
MIHREKLTKEASEEKFHERMEKQKLYFRRIWKI